MKIDLKLYRGYVNDSHLVVFGHVFKSWAPDRYPLDYKGFKHAMSIINMFRIKPMKNMEVTLQFQSLRVTTKTFDDGYFRFDVPFYETLESGWHNYTVSCRLNEMDIVENGELLKPYSSKLGIISDIDDTFLVSYSNNIFRKLYVMLYRNINKRKVFEEVVQHYRQLSIAGHDNNNAFNSFFYVSSSEWNLYNLINAVIEREQLPKAVIKLKDIKAGIADFLFTGNPDHSHKFYKIKDIIAFYPDIKYVLLGDDAQHDALIYEKICKIHPGCIQAVYLRQSGKEPKRQTRKILNNIESLNVATCYFKHSEKAIRHSKGIGII